MTSFFSRFLMLKYLRVSRYSITIEPRLIPEMGQRLPGLQHVTEDDEEDGEEGSKGRERH